MTSVDVAAKPDVVASRSRTRLFIETAVVALVVLFLATTAAARLAPTWDEGDAVFRAERVSEWFYALWHGPETLRAREMTNLVPEGSQRRELRRYFQTLPSRRALFRREVREIGFQHAIYREGHPAGYTEMIALGDALARCFRLDAIFSEIVALRFGGILFFSLAVAAVWRRLVGTFGRFAATAACVGLLSCPHVFCHALIAGGDSLLISSWLLTWALFRPGIESRKRAFVRACAWGLAAGLSFSAKFSGLLVVAPLCAVAYSRAFLCRPRRRAFWEATFELAVGIAVAFLFFMLVNPTLWDRPIHNLEVFYRLNTRREGFNIPGYFFGRIYTLDHPLPFWSGAFWIVATTPIFLMTSAAFCVLYAAIPRRDASGRPQERRGRVLVTTAAALGVTLPAALAIPGTPVHDGVRLMIASAAFWGALGGLGVAIFAEKCSARFMRRRAMLRATVALAALTPGVLDTLCVAPSFLSFYSAATGGVAGAVRRGFDPTYYWDSLDDVVARKLRAALEDAREQGRPNAILFSSFSSSTLELYRRMGILGDARLATISDPSASRDPDDYAFYVYQRRPDVMTQYDLLVIKSFRLVLTKKIRNPLPNPFCNGGENISILEVYDMSRPQ